MNRIKKVISLLLILIVMVTFPAVGGVSTPVSAAGTGAGLAEHALNAYYEGWSYVYGAASYGAVDCSGLIYMYSGSGSRVDMMGSSYETGSTAYGIPNIHGLGLYEPGHVGVYVGGGMAVDARSEGYGVCYQSVYSKGWTNWFKVAGVSYPTDGWEYFNGEYYYYEDGEYLTDTYVTVDGVSYYLDSTGVSTEMGPADDSSSDSSSGSTESKYLKVGSSGDKVTELQYRLTELGFYNGDITGYYGEQTEAAYKRFQKAAGLYADGIAGEDELSLLYSDSAPTGSIAEVGTQEEEKDTETDTTENTVEENDTEQSADNSQSTTYTNGDFNDDVAQIQGKLQSLGYFNDEATGYYGDVTQSAVIKFQFENGLNTTGEVDEITYKTLFSAKALENPYSEDKGERRVIYNPNKTSITNVDSKEDIKVDSLTTVKPVVNSSDGTLKSAQLASKALEGVKLDKVENSSSSSSRTNGNFIVWLIIMIVLMSGAFWFVFTTEKKKKKARYERIKARANRNW